MDRRTPRDSSLNSTRTVDSVEPGRRRREHAGAWRRERAKAWRRERASIIRDKYRQKGVTSMESSETPVRVLVVAHKTAATQPLLDAVRERARRGPLTLPFPGPNAPPQGR